LNPSKSERKPSKKITFKLLRKGKKGRRLLKEKGIEHPDRLKKEVGTLEGIPVRGKKNFLYWGGHN